jgi:hypothetical protein
MNLTSPGIQFVAQSELDFLYKVVLSCRDKRHGRDGIWQLAPVQCTILWTNDSATKLEELAERIGNKFPRLKRFAADRVRKAYGNHQDTITKPNYARRIDTNYVGYNGSQIERIVQLYTREPDSGGMVFSVFHPSDLSSRRRPGYVPCLLTGVFLVHHGEVHLNAFFRSQSIVEFGIADLVFLRKLQISFADQIAGVPLERMPRRRGPPKLRPGPLNLQFGRIIIQDRVARDRSGFLRRAEIMDEWLDLLREILETKCSPRLKSARRMELVG